MYIYIYIYASPQFRLVACAEDLVLEVHSQTQGQAAAPVEARAQAVRELTQHVVPAVFRVLDFDQNGNIGAHEFIRGALLLLATVPISPLGIIFYFCLYKTQEDIEHIVFVKVLRGVKVQGAPLDTPQLADLAFRVVDTDADGFVTSAELLRWVKLSLEHEAHNGS